MFRKKSKWISTQLGPIGCKIKW